MCAGGRGQAFYIHPCPSPSPSITRLIFPSPPPQSHRNLQRLLSAAHQQIFFFFSLGFVKCFLGFRADGGAFFPFFILFFFLFNVFHGVLG